MASSRGEPACSASSAKVSEHAYPRQSAKSWLIALTVVWAGADRLLRLEHIAHYEIEQEEIKSHNRESTPVSSGFRPPKQSSYHRQNHMWNYDRCLNPSRPL